MTIFFLILWALIALLPMDRLVEFGYLHFRRIQSQLDRPQSLIRFSRYPLIYTLIKALEVVKGFALPFAVEQFFYYNPVFTTIALLATIICHNWSPFYGGRNRLHGAFVLWGCYIFLMPSMFWLFPVAGLLLALVLNTPYTAMLVTMFMYAVLFWLEQAPDSTMLMNGLLMLVVLVALWDALWEHYTKGSGSLKALFHKRS